MRHVATLRSFATAGTPDGFGTSSCASQAVLATSALQATPLQARGQHTRPVPDAADSMPLAMRKDFLTHLNGECRLHMKVG